MNISSSVNVFHSNSCNIVENLALEETLMSQIEPESEILFLYENSPAIVTGRFQNPWRECRTALARRKGIPLCRRISGGGTVVHGPGNLNFAVIRKEKIPRKEYNLQKIIQAAATLGIRIESNNRQDLLLPLPSGKSAKISGSAFRQTSGASLHHGTLLVNADLQQIRTLLRQPVRYIADRGVASTPSSIENLSAIEPSITTGKLKNAITECWLESAGQKQNKAVEISAEWEADNPVFQKAVETLSSKEWIWGKTPSFREFFPDLPSQDLFGENSTGKTDCSNSGSMANLPKATGHAKPDSVIFYIQVDKGLISKAGFSLCPKNPPAEYNAKTIADFPEDTELSKAFAGPLKKLTGAEYNAPSILAALKSENLPSDWLQALAARVGGDG